MNEEKIFFTVSEAARRTGLSAGFIRAGVKARRFPFVMAGNRVLLNLPRLLEVLENEAEGGRA